MGAIIYLVSDADSSNDLPRVIQREMWGFNSDQIYLTPGNKVFNKGKI